MAVLGWGLGLAWTIRERGGMSTSANPLPRACTNSGPTDVLSRIWKRETGNIWLSCRLEVIRALRG